MTISTETRQEAQASGSSSLIPPAVHGRAGSASINGKASASSSRSRSRSTSSSPDTILVKRVKGIDLSVKPPAHADTAKRDRSAQPSPAPSASSSSRLPAKMSSNHGPGYASSPFASTSILGNRSFFGQSNRIAKQKKNPLFLEEHRAHARSQTKRRISSLTETLKTEVRKALRMTSIDELLHKRLAVERHLASAFSKPVSDEDTKVRHLRELLQRSQDRHTASLRPSRRKLKEQERIAQEEKLLRRRALGIAGRKPLPGSLEPEHEAFVDKTFRKPGNIASITGAGVASQDVQKLQPGQWLNDEVINFYMKMIELRSTEAVQKRAEARKAKARLAAGACDETGEGGVDAARLRDIQLVAEGKKKWNGIWNVHTFNTFFYEKLSKGGYAGVRQWTRRIDLFSKDRILIPINLGQAHWVCAMINMRDCRFEYYDSMAMSNSKVFPILRDYLASEYVDKKKEAHGPLDLSGWKTYASERSPQQRNGYDCGVFAAMTIEQLSRRHPLDGPLDDELNAERLVKHSNELAANDSRHGLDDDDADDDIDEEWNFSQTNIPYLRRRMVYEIATTKLLDT